MDANEREINSFLKFASVGVHSRLGGCASDFSLKLTHLGSCLTRGGRISESIRNRSRGRGDSRRPILIARPLPQSLTWCTSRRLPRRSTWPRRDHVIGASQ